MVTDLFQPAEPEIPQIPATQPRRHRGRRRRRARRGQLRIIRLGLMIVLLVGTVGGLEGVPPPEGTQVADDDPTALLPSVNTINRLRSSRLAFDILVSQRERALLDGDLDGFLADLDPKNEDLIDNQTLVFENLQDLPVSNYAQERDSYLRPNPPTRADPEDDWVSGNAYVATQVQFDEADPRPTVIRHRWDLELRGGNLVIADIKPAQARYDYGPAPWETAELTSARTDHMLVLATPDVADRAREVANAAERAYARSEPLWPSRGIDDEFVIFATAERDLFESWYGGLDAVTIDATGWALAVPTCCGEDEEVVGDFASVHIAIDLSQLADRIDLEWILAHELTHAVAQPLSSASNTTRMLWADEGYAEYVGVRLLARYNYVANWDDVAREYARGDDFDGELPRDEDFYDEETVGAHYALSVRFFEFLADRYGRSDVRDFYFDLNSMAVPDANAAMEEHFGESQDDLVDDWARWVRS